MTLNQFEVTIFSTSFFTCSDLERNLKILKNSPYPMQEYQSSLICTLEGESGSQLTSLGVGGRGRTGVGMKRSGA